MKTKMIKSDKKGIRLGTQGYYHAMIIPGLIFVLLFCYGPMFGLVMAFQKFVPAKGILGSKWIGLKNFKDLFSNNDIWELVRNTTVISLGKIILREFLALVFAIFLNEIVIKRLKKYVQTIVYLPHFLSWVVLASIFRNLFGLDGMVNSLLVNAGLDKINFIGSNSVFQQFVIVTDSWKEFGYSSIMFLAAITAIDPGLHEAAAIDGASWLQRVFNVTIPGMLPIIVLVLAIDMTGILNAGFDQIYNLYSPGVYERGDILDTYVYRVGLVNMQYGFATAVGLLKSVVGMVLMLSVNAFSKKAVGRSVF